MRILLVNPPRSLKNLIREHAPPEVRPHVHHKLIGPPLPLIALAGNLAGHEVEVLDLKAEGDLRDDDHLEWESLLDESLVSFRPRVVGVTFNASEYRAGCRILRRVRESDPRIVTAAGGIHAALVPRDFDLPFVDFVFLSQAKATFRRVVEHLDDEVALWKVPNIARRTEEGLRFTPRADVFSDPGLLLEDVRPDRDLISKYREAYRLRKDTPPATYLFTSLGCEGRCTFCSIWPQARGRVFYRPVENILGELREIDQPVVRFADPDTFGDIDRAHHLFDRILAEGIRKEFVADARIDTAAHNPDLIEKAAAAGLRVVICGIESDSPEELRDFQKPYDPALVSRAVDVFHRSGISVRGNYIVQPHFTETEFRRMERFADRHRVAFAGFTVATPMPGTVFHRQVRDRITVRDLDHYNFMNAVLPTALPEKDFYERLASLWKLKRGEEVI
jgi:radical SAM superfamily enzyme YgiQ (UPF0313 family)